MIPQFKGLNDKEQKLLTDAIPMITVLIAGADGNIDSEEKEWANKVMEIRGYKHPVELEGYYAIAGENFAARLDQLINELPQDTNARNQMISDELAQLNAIFPKMDPHHAAHFYESFTTFAEHVAKASGGFLRFGAISRDEAKYVDLPMVTKVHMPEPEEDNDTEA